MPRDIPPAPAPSESAPERFLELLTAEAEHGLLGSIMSDNRIYDRVADIVDEAHFSYAVHGRIFAEIGRLIAARTPANPITLRRMAEDDPALKDLGGARYLVQLVTSAPTLLNGPWYAEQIADAAYRRVLVDRLQLALQDAAAMRADRTYTEVLDEHEHQIAQLRDGRSEERSAITAAAAVDAALAMAEEVYKADGKLVGITTGLADLDRWLGGLHRTDLVIAAGRPGMGKSALATTIAEGAARSGKRVYFASLEMSADQIAARQIAARGGPSAERQRIGPLSRDDMNRMIEAAEPLKLLPIQFDDGMMNSIASLRSRIRRHRRRAGVDLVIVDYLQLLVTDRAENRVNEVSSITRGLKAIAKDFEVPVVALSQLNRALEQREDKRPQLSDLRESGSIEQDADVVMFLYRDEYYAAQEEPQRRERESGEAFTQRVSAWTDRCQQSRNVAEIIIRKNRHGSTRTVRTHFDAERTAFSNLAWGRDNGREET